MAYYRIVRDKFAGFEVQRWCWHWPFWVQAGGTNTHASVEKARQYAKDHSGKVVEYMGRL